MLARGIKLATTLSCALWGPSMQGCRVRVADMYSSSFSSRTPGSATRNTVSTEPRSDSAASRIRHSVIISHIAAVIVPPDVVLVTKTYLSSADLWWMVFRSLLLRGLATYSIAAYSHLGLHASTACL